MTDRIIRQQKAFSEALWHCRAWGLNWRTHIEPKIERKEITGYYVLDETRSTTVATIKMHSDEKRRRDPGGVDIEKAFAGSGHLYKKEKDHKVTESAKRAALNCISTTYQTFLL